MIASTNEFVINLIREKGYEFLLRIKLMLNGEERKAKKEINIIEENSLSNVATHSKEFNKYF